MPSSSPRRFHAAHEPMAGGLRDRSRTVLMRLRSSTYRLSAAEAEQLADDLRRAAVRARMADPVLAVAGGAVELDGVDEAS